MPGGGGEGAGAVFGTVGAKPGIAAGTSGAAPQARIVPVSPIAGAAATSRSRVCLTATLYTHLPAPDPLRGPLAEVCGRSRQAVVRTQEPDVVICGREDTFE